MERIENIRGAIHCFTWKVNGAWHCLAATLPCIRLVDNRDNLRGDMKIQSIRSGASGSPLAGKLARFSRMSPYWFKGPDWKPQEKIGCNCVNRPLLRSNDFLSRQSNHRVLTIGMVLFLSWFREHRWMLGFPCWRPTNHQGSCSWRTSRQDIRRISMSWKQMLASLSKGREVVHTPCNRVG